MVKNKKKIVKDVAILTLGAFIAAVGDYFFKLPNNFSNGGMTGVSVILGYLIKTIPAATFVLILNVLFLIIGFIFLGKEFGWKTIYCSLAFSGFVQLFQLIIPMSKPFTDDTLLELLFAVIIVSVGIAIALRAGGSTGGTDIIAMIIRKYSKMDISISMFIADCVIAGSSFFLIDERTGMYSLLGLMLKSFIIQAAINIVNRRKGMLIITSKRDEISDYIMKEHHRGVTVWNSEGAYTHEEKYVLFTVVNNYQAAVIRANAKKIDEHVFVTIINSSEIYGKGFLEKDSND
ncbi:MAG: YitT family protein [Clostridiales bacterium]|nr:YitT family protein [Clostridiales bacterium]